MKLLRNTTLFALAALALAAPCAQADMGKLSQGTLVGWGADQYGQSTVPTGTDFTQASAGWYHSLARKSDGTLIGWGYDLYNQATVPGGMDFSQVSGGGYHSVALKIDGGIEAWGNNGNGQITVPLTTDFSRVSAGYVHNLALKTDGSLAAWGNDGYGQSTVPAGTDFAQVSAGGYHSLALKTDGSLAGWGSNDNNNQSTVPTGVDFVQVAAGMYHSLALRADGSIVGWGYDNYGQASVPAGTDFTQVSAGSYHGLALMADGSLVAWGYDNYGQVSGVPIVGYFLDISAGDSHNVALKARDVYDDLDVSGTGLDLLLQRPVTVSGNVIISGMMTMENNPIMTTAGLVTIQPTGGISGAGTINGRVINQGTVVAGVPGEDLIFNGLVSGAGSFTGSVVFNGGFSPGTGLASLPVGWATFSTTNTLTMELAGTTSGTEHDHLNVLNLAAFDGTLSVEPILGFEPGAGQVFNLFDGPLSGTFEHILLPLLAKSLSWNTDDLYTTGEIYVVVPEPATVGLLALGGLVILKNRRRRK